MRAKAEIIRTLLALSPARCADLAVAKGLSDPTPESEALNRAARALFRAQIEAEYAGYTTPQPRGPAAPEDRQAVVTALLSRHISRAEIETAMTVGAMMLPAPRRCPVQLAYFDAIANAPKPMAGRMIVHVMQYAVRPLGNRPATKAGR